MQKINFTYKYQFTQFVKLHLNILKKTAYFTSWPHNANNFWLESKSKRKVFGFRGHRHGSPFSLFLFIVVMDILSGLLDRGLGTRLVEGFGMGKDKFQLSLLLIPFSFVVGGRIRLLTLVRSFKSLSGLSINREKYQVAVAGINCEPSKLGRCLSGPKIWYLAVTYLGLPLGHNPRSHYF